MGAAELTEALSVQTSMSMSMGKVEESTGPPLVLGGQEWTLSEPPRSRQCCGQEPHKAAYETVFLPHTWCPVRHATLRDSAAAIWTGVGLTRGHP